MDSSFKDEDKEKVILFLNMVAEKAKFNDIDIKEIIRFYGLLSYMQSSLLSKIEANTLEIEGVRELKKDPKTKTKK